MHHFDQSFYGEKSKAKVNLIKYGPLHAVSQVTRHVTCKVQALIEPVKLWEELLKLYRFLQREESARAYFLSDIHRKI